jgi:hypothetical protein
MPSSTTTSSLPTFLRISKNIRKSYFPNDEATLKKMEMAKDLRDEVGK